jgi:hypothetical protein
MRLALGVLAALALPALASAGDMERGGLRFSLPKGWEEVRSSSPLVVAQFRIPRVRSDKEDGELILFQFEDTEKGGRVSDTLERWYAQFTQPDGRASKDAAVVSTRVVNGLDVKSIDLSGTYRPLMGPMEHASKPDYRLLGAVVEGPGGRWFWRAVGPAKTMASAKAGFDGLVDSFAAGR